jgi:hypothetical protein
MTAINKEKSLPDGIMHLAEIFCGCVTTENTWQPIIDELERLDRGEYKRDDDLAASIVDHLKLSEHGTSIRGGWLTPLGKEALEFLREHGADWADKGTWIGSDGCSYGEKRT